MRETVHPDLTEGGLRPHRAAMEPGSPSAFHPPLRLPQVLARKLPPWFFFPTETTDLFPDLWPFSVLYKWTRAVWSLLRPTSPTQHNLLTWPCTVACVTHCHPGPLPGVVDRGVFIHSPADGHLSCFQALAMRNRTPLNIHRTSPQLDHLTHRGAVLLPVLLQVAMLLSFLPLHTKGLLSSTFQYDFSHLPLRPHCQAQQVLPAPTRCPVPRPMLCDLGFVSAASSSGTESRATQQATSNSVL